MAMRAHLVPLPRGKIKEVVPAFVIGPSTKLEADVPDVEEPAIIFRIFATVEFIFPLVSVSAPFTVIAFPNVMADDKGEVVLFIVRLLKVVAVEPPMVCADVPENKTVFPVLV